MNKNILKKSHLIEFLLDAPCSGLRCNKKKTRYEIYKKRKDLLQLQNIQKTLLESVSTLLKKGGILVYSTCTVDKEENQNVVVRTFLQKHSEYDCDHDIHNRVPEKIRPLVENGDIANFTAKF